MDAEKNFFRLMEQRRTYGSGASHATATLADLVQIEAQHVPTGRRTHRTAVTDHGATHAPFARLSHAVAKVA